MRYINFIVILLLANGCSIDFSVAPWSDGRIPYYLKGDFTSEELSDLDRAMSSWETVADISFEEVTPQSSAYEIRRVFDQGWSSTIGENNVKCYMNYKANSPDSRYEHILHELGHCIGLYHEHQRPDRSAYVKINYENILPSEIEEFDIKDNPLLIETDFPYDFNSIMHYPAYAFSINGEKTIETMGDDVIDRLGIITEQDAMKVQSLYGLPEDKEKYSEFMKNQVISNDIAYRFLGDIY